MYSTFYTPGLIVIRLYISGTQSTPSQNLKLYISGTQSTPSQNLKLTTPSQNLKLIERSKLLKDYQLFLPEYFTPYTIDASHWLKHIEASSAEYYDFQGLYHTVRIYILHVCVEP